MANEKKKLDWTKLNKYKLLWFIVGLLIIVPLVLIPVTYIGTYNKNKPDIFVEEAYQNAEFVKEVKDFTIETYASSISYKTKDNDGSISIKFRLSNNNSNFHVTSIDTFKYMYGANWIKYSSSIGSFSTIKIDSTTFTSASKTVISQDFPIKPLWFVKVKNPDLYVYIKYTGTINGETVTKEIITKIKPNVYFDSSKTKIE